MIKSRSIDAVALDGPRIETSVEVVWIRLFSPLGPQGTTGGPGPPSGANEGEARRV